ncbi:orotidine 5'-phosphate decarboxylase / HUMPS family protein [Clostridioides difficile DA00313]|nr:orotidine 5'-phosphate decarboxylase / HUMPS family protein [Clostridioides difficile]EQH80713.1 orotidine 5'-phosphate decarboxylase / HUMPS family protein [Clostridioides difficile DA00313]
MINGKEKLIVAIDTDEFDKAKELIDRLEDSVDIFKVGLEQYVATKGKTIDYLKEKGKKIFLDLKFHDIPNTMKSAVKAAVRDNVWLMTIHVSDMEGMRQCALIAREEAERLNIEKPLVVGVTVLTSLSNQDYRT